MNDKPSESREPIVGTYEPGSRADILELPIHVGFDNAWRDAMDQADRMWRRGGEESIEVSVELEARIDFWNPGGIGQYRIKVTEQPSS
jgi:hypothetical protein